MGNNPVIQSEPFLFLMALEIVRKYVRILKGV